MIIDRLDGAHITTALPPRLAQALDFLRRTDTAALSIGRHDIDGDRLFALVQEYTSRPPDQCVWEAHRAHIDVQYVARGIERMGYTHISQAVEREPYDGARDVTFFEPGGDFVTVRAGTFTIFGPEDVHAPGHAAGAPLPVLKIVVKVRIE